MSDDGDHGKGLLKRKPKIPQGINFIMRDATAEQSRKSLFSGPDSQHGLAGGLARSVHLVSKRLKKDFGDQRPRLNYQSHIQSHNSSMLKLGLKNDAKTTPQEDGIVLLSADADETIV